MSLINGMLRDLETRKSDVAGTPATSPQIRAVAVVADGHRGRWYLLTAALLLALVAWIFLSPLEVDKVATAAPPVGVVASNTALPAVAAPAPVTAVAPVVVDEKERTPLLAPVGPAPAAGKTSVPKPLPEEPRVAFKAGVPGAPKVAATAEGIPRPDREAIPTKAATPALPQKLFMQAEETHPATQAMNSARLQLEKGDLHGAIETIERSLPEGSDRADYQAFLAALLQRDEQHKRAVEHFLLALKKSPQAGVLWLGLGISRQALQQINEAQDAFRRAKDSNTLTPELQAFVDVRLAQLSR